MNNTEKTVSTVDALVAATKDKSAHHIVVHGRLTDAPSINLLPGQTLRGNGDGAALIFAAKSDGLRLSTDNRVHEQDSGVTISADLAGLSAVMERRCAAAASSSAAAATKPAGWPCGG